MTAVSFAKYTHFPIFTFFTLQNIKMKPTDNFFVKIDPSRLTGNCIRIIGDEWMLITAGTPEKFNTMTASWGTMGVLWDKPVAICFIRPTRHTFSFANAGEFFTLSFFTADHRKILNYCGAHSGRNVDKIAATGLKPLLTENNGITFEQSRLCFECRKLYADDLKPDKFIFPSLETRNYPRKDYHRFFIGEILNCYQRIETR
jgi:flavin reductase (DIM6/NTAB) family NADH-FMN oxidoreductase RutF